MHGHKASTLNKTEIHMFNYFLNHENDYISLGFVVTCIVCTLVGGYAILSGFGRLISMALGAQA
jgi:hypothetical protein